MKATLYPEKTDCFFYLHDEEGNIHCAKTYEGHKANIEKYLRLLKQHPDIYGRRKILHSFYTPSSQ